MLYPIIRQIAILISYSHHTFLVWKGKFFFSGAGSYSVTRYMTADFACFFFSGAGSRPASSSAFGLFGNVLLQLSYHQKSFYQAAALCK